MNKRDVLIQALHEASIVLADNPIGLEGMTDEDAEKYQQAMTSIALGLRKRAMRLERKAQRKGR